MDDFQHETHETHEAHNEESHECNHTPDGPLNFVIPPTKEDSVGFLESCPGQVAHLHKMSTNIYKDFNINMDFGRFFSMVITWYLTGRNTAIYELVNSEDPLEDLPDLIDEIVTKSNGKTE